MPDIRTDDTIAAIATPIGEGGISVIRISGPEAFALAGKIFESPKARIADAASHTVHFGKIRDEKGNILDQALVTLFRAPNSYTAQDVIEISAHGGLIVTKKILDLIIRSGARHAEPGEFTKRAFLNGKIDLTQAEAVLDLIRAKSDKSLETALRQLGGALAQKFRGLKDELMKMYAHMEAFLDFPDEHLEVYEDKAFLEKFGKVRAEISKLIASFGRGNLLREGVAVVLAGKPNVGKSSLFNTLLARDRALVSEHAGTTRDLLEEAVEIGGLYVRLMDTAGLSAAPAHPVEALGMERTRDSLRQAHLLVYLVDGSAPLEEADRMVFKELRELMNKPVLVVINKSDLEMKVDIEELKKLTGEKEFVRVSAKTVLGIEALEKNIAGKILQSSAEVSGEQITRLRHKNALERAEQALERAEAAFKSQESLEFVIVDLKAALEGLRELIGEVYSEDLLDVIFSEFCIGK